MYEPFLVQPHEWPKSTTRLVKVLVNEQQIVKDWRKVLPHTQGKTVKCQFLKCQHPFFYTQDRSFTDDIYADGTFSDILRLMFRASVCKTCLLSHSRFGNSIAVFLSQILPLRVPKLYGVPKYQSRAEQGK